MRDGICFEQENVVANDMQSATTRSEWRDLSAFSPSVKTEDQPVFELAARLATGKPDLMIQVPHKRNIRFPQKREPDIWSEWRDLNPRPLGPEPSAIPNFATPR